MAAICSVTKDLYITVFRFFTTVLRKKQTNKKLKQSTQSTMNIHVITAHPSQKF